MGYGFLHIDTYCHYIIRCFSKEQLYLFSILTMHAFIKIGVIAICSFLLCHAIYRVIEKGRDKYFYHSLPQFKELLEPTKPYDLLMLGSSRTHVHNDPRIIDSITGLNSFNAGIDGANMVSMYIMLKGYLETHRPPRLILVEISMYSFKVDEGHPLDATFYFRYLDNKAVYQSLNESWKYSGFFKHVPFLRLTQFDDINKTYGFKGLAGKKEMLFGNTYKGYAENSMKVISDTVTHSEFGCSYVYYVEKGRDYVDKILSTCREKNIHAVVIYSPEYRQLNYACPDGKRVIDTITALAKRYNYPFWNYLYQPICENPAYFANIGHLNKAGAEKFSVILAEDVKKYMAQNHY